MLSLLLACSSAPLPERVIALAWGGRLETTTDLSSLPSRDFTLAIRYFPMFRHGPEGPIIAASGAVPLSVGYADWLAADQPALLVRAGGAWGLFEDPGPGWHDLALTYVASSGALTLYVDHTRRCTFRSSPEAAADCGLSVLLPGPVEGRLWLGRSPLQRGARVAQFYGFVDDFLVYNRALHESEIPALKAGPAQPPPPAGYVAAYRFPTSTPDSSPDGPEYAQHGTAAFYDLAPDRDPNRDAELFPSPGVRDWEPPFVAGAEWEVVRGWEDVTAGHVGPMAFLQDFAYRGKGEARLVSPHQLRVSALGVSGARPYVCLERKREQHLCLRDLDLAPGLELGQILAEGAPLGVAREEGGVATVQISGSDAPEPAVSTRLVTYPLGFTQYEASTDGLAWQAAQRGAVRVGQRVRR